MLSVSLGGCGAKAKVRLQICVKAMVLKVKPWSKVNESEGCVNCEHYDSNFSCS